MLVEPGDSAAIARRARLRRGFRISCAMLADSRPSAASFSCCARCCSSVWSSMKMGLAVRLLGELTELPSPLVLQAPAKDRRGCHRTQRCQAGTPGNEGFSPCVRGQAGPARPVAQADVATLVEHHDPGARRWTIRRLRRSGRRPRPPLQAVISRPAGAADFLDEKRGAVEAHRQAGLEEIRRRRAGMSER